MMKRLVSLGFLPVILVSGCAFGNKTSTLAPGEYAAVNERSSRQEATLRLDDGTSRHARNLRLEAGTASYVDPDTGAAASLPVDHIAQVRYLSRSRGVKIGGTWGFLIFEAIGLAMLSDDVDTQPGFAAMVFLGPLGWVLGAAVGAAVGADDIYQFPTNPRSP